jgi:hypothetical protein
MDTTAATVATGPFRVTTRLVFDLDADLIRDGQLEQELWQLLQQQAGVDETDIFSLRVLRGSVVAVIITTRAAASLIVDAAKSGTLLLRGAPATLESNETAETESAKHAVATYVGAGTGAVVLLLIVLLLVRKRAQSGRVAMSQTAEVVVPKATKKGFFRNPMYAPHGKKPTGNYHDIENEEEV